MSGDVWWKLTGWRPGAVDWSSGVFASCITRVQLYVNACNWMAAVCAAAPLALANQLPLPRLYSALVRSSRKLRYIRIRPLPFTFICPTRHKQDAARDGRLRPRWLDLSNWTKVTKHTRRLWFWPIRSIAWKRDINRKYITYCIAVTKGPSHDHR